MNISSLNVVVLEIFSTVNVSEILIHRKSYLIFNFTMDTSTSLNTDIYKSCFNLSYHVLKVNSLTDLTVCLLFVRHDTDNYFTNTDYV